MIPIKNKNLLKIPKFAEKNTFAVYNPANQKILAEVPNLEKMTVLKAIKKAQSSFISWKKISAKNRSNSLYRWYELIMKNQEDLAKIMVLEQGKPFIEAKAEVIYGASFVSWFAEQAKRICGSIIHNDDKHTFLQYTKEPIGVVGVITPWNFPIAMITRKVAPALAAGCSVLLKPSELTPLCAIALANLAYQAGISKDLFQVLPSTHSHSVGEIFCKSKIVRKISFTGSSRVGKLLFAQSADSIKRMSLELGGNAVFIVFESADLEKAAKQLLLCKFRNTGQTCVCANRILVQESIFPEFLKKFQPLVAGLKVGDGLKQGVEQGPLIQKSALVKVKQHIQQAKKDGAKILLGGKEHSLGGLFFEPTLLVNVKPYSIFWEEETFGPVAPITSFSNEKEAIELANATDYGLANYFCSRDFQQIHRINQQLDSGIVGINTGVISSEIIPFGGIKESGIGREGSQLGIEEYLEIKYTMSVYD